MLNNYPNMIKEFNSVSSFVEWISNQKRFSKKTSLDKMNYLMSLFNYPNKSFNSIHVTGTNGKGSTVSFLRTIYKEAGYKVASFTSPYIVEFNERIWYDGNNISDKNLLDIANLIISKYDIIINDGYELPTFFEFITTLAYIYFSTLKDLDIAIIEVGIGGRLDSTNVINPYVSLITNVTLEHTNTLGNSTSLILREKCGIIKQNSCVISTIKNNSLRKQLINYANNVNSKCIIADCSNIKIKKLDLDYSLFDYLEYLDVSIKLIGSHQVENAILAIECVEYLNNYTKTCKRQLYVPRVLLYKGLYNTLWVGRLEKVSSDPLIYLDGGHNIDCIKRVVEFINTTNFKYKRCVISISNDKNKEKMISLLDNAFDELVFTKYEYKRSAEANDLYSLSKSNNKLLINNIDEAIKYVYSNIVDFTLFIGSLYLISEVRSKIS